MLFGDAIEPPEMALGLVPKVLDAIDVVGLISKQLRMIDTGMVELGNIEHIVSAEAVRIDDAIGLDPLPHDREKRLSTGIWDDDGMNLAAAFEQPEDRNFARSSPPALALSDATKIALINLDFTAQERRCLGFQPGRNQLAKLVKEQPCRVPVHTGQGRRRTRCCTRHEILDEFVLNTWSEPAPAPNANHLTQLAFLSYLGQPLYLFSFEPDLCYSIPE